MKFLTITYNGYAKDKKGEVVGWWDGETLHIDTDYKFYMELCQKCEDEGVKWQDIDKAELLYGKY